MTPSIMTSRKARTNSMFSWLASIPDSALLSQSEIADELYVSRNTVKSHSKSIYRKLRVTSRGRAALRAQELGLI